MSEWFMLLVLLLAIAVPLGIGFHLAIAHLEDRRDRRRGLESWKPPMVHWQTPGGLQACTLRRPDRRVSTDLAKVTCTQCRAEHDARRRDAAARDLLGKNPPGGAA